jgi:histidinol phosphatase-like enzyme
MDGEMYMTDLDDICTFLEDEAGVDHVLYALNKDSDLYKPNNGMIEALIRTYEIDRSKSYMIGDRWKDIVPGNKSGLTTIYVGIKVWNIPDEYGDIKPDFIKEDLWSACKLIMELNNGL